MESTILFQYLIDIYIYILLFDNDFIDKYIRLKYQKKGYLNYRR